MFLADLSTEAVAQAGFRWFYALICADLMIWAKMKYPLISKKKLGQLINLNSPSLKDWIKGIVHNLQNLGETLSYNTDHATKYSKISLH